MAAQGKIEALNNAIQECIPATKEAAENNPFADMVVRASRFQMVHAGTSRLKPQSNPSLGKTYLLVA